MLLRKAETVSALCIAALAIAACSDEPATSNHQGPVVAPNSGSGGNGGSAPPAVGRGGHGSAGMSGMSGAGNAIASSGRSGVAGSFTSPAGAPAGGASAGGMGAGSGGGAAGAAGDTPPAVACNPADKKPDPTPASFTQIMGYRGLAMPPTTGASKPVLEEDPGLPDWTVYRPETLGGGALHPVLAWGNGGCLRNGTLYGPWLLELASHGYIVLADGPPTEAGSDPVGAGMRAGADGSVLVQAIEWLIAENDRPCSQYYQKVAVTKLAVAGQSCGGLMALASAGDERITTAIIGNSGLFAADQRTYSALHSPIAYLIGGPSDIAYSNAERDFSNINNVPIFYANMDVGHGGTWNARNGGEFGRVGLAWLNWHLRDDANARKLFVGTDCELCQPSSMWTVEKKMID